MNFNDKPTGWPTGNLNWAATEEGRRAKSLRKRGLTLEMEYGAEKAKQIKEKLSKSRTGIKTGKPAWNTGLTKETSDSVASISNSLSRNTPWNKGLKTGIQTFTGASHKEETVALLKEKQRFNRQHSREICPYCAKSIDKANYARYHGDKCKLKG